MAKNIFILFSMHTICIGSLYTHINTNIEILCMKHIYIVLNY